MLKEGRQLHAVESAPLPAQETARNYTALVRQAEVRCLNRQARKIDLFESLDKVALALEENAGAVDRGERLADVAANLVEIAGYLRSLRQL